MNSKRILLKCCFVLIGVFVCAVLAGEFQKNSDEDSGEKQNMAKMEVYSTDESKLILTDKVEKSDDEWRQSLTPEQYKIMRKKGTERAFTGAYHDLKDHGIYKCAACGNDLFFSDNKFDSGTGWPSFWQPVSEHNVDTENDDSFFMHRVEVLCSRCGAHLGHVFEDGPKPTGMRYCINSASLQFKKK